MKYITRQPNDAFGLEPYEDYLDGARKGLSACIHGPELLTLSRFIPRGPESFHDARFERLTAMAAGGEDGVPKSVSVEIRLKGPYFDRYFELLYKDVAECSLQLPRPEADLLMHEIREENGLLVHEFLFWKDKTVEIACRELHFRERVEDASAPASSAR